MQKPIVMPIIHDGELTVRPFQTEDATSLAHALNNPKVTERLTNIPQPYGFWDASRWINTTTQVVTADSTRVNFAIEYQAHVVGSVSFINVDLQQEHVNSDMLDDEYYIMDRPAAEARLFRICDLASDSNGAPFGGIHIIWPHKGRKEREELRHGGTVIWLHGLGGGANIGEMARNITQRFDMPWLKYIFPVAPAQPVSVLGGGVTNSWFDITRLSEGGTSEDAIGLRRCGDYISKIVQDEIVRGVPPEKVLVVGFGQGAHSCVQIRSVDS